MKKLKKKGAPVGGRGLRGDIYVRAYIPFLIFAAAMDRSRCDLALAISGSGGREYRVKISYGGGIGLSG